MPTGADATHADWLRTGHEISGNVVEFEPEVALRDVFYLDEARIRQNLIGPIARVWIDQFRSDPEIAAASRTLPNPIALPEIAVSRINASHVAVRLPSDRSLATGTRGRLVDGAVTDAAGRPTPFTSTVNYATEPSADPAVWVIRPDEFEPDPLLERRLLAEHLDSNHRFRTGAWSTRPGSVAAVAHPAGDGFSALAAADVLERALPGAAQHPDPQRMWRHRARERRHGGLYRPRFRTLAERRIDHAAHELLSPARPFEGVQR